MCSIESFDRLAETDEEKDAPWRHVPGCAGLVGGGRRGLGLRLCRLVSGCERQRRLIELQQQVRMSTTMKMDPRSCAKYQLTMINKSTNLKWLWRQRIGDFEPGNTRYPPIVGGK
jgi:hypothetical protein